MWLRKAGPASPQWSHQPTNTHKRPSKGGLPHQGHRHTHPCTSLQPQEQRKKGLAYTATACWLSFMHVQQQQLPPCPYVHFLLYIQCHWWHKKDKVQQPAQKQQSPRPTGRDFGPSPGALFAPRIHTHFALLPPHTTWGAPCQQEAGGYNLSKSAPDQILPSCRRHLRSGGRASLVSH